MSTSPAPIPIRRSAKRPKTRSVAAHPHTLKELEKIIEHGIRAEELAKLEQGKTLREIRDRKLYKRGYKTFEAYCWQRWRMSRTTAYERIRVADVRMSEHRYRTHSLTDRNPSFSYSKTLLLARLNGKDRRAVEADVKTFQELAFRHCDWRSIM